MNIKYMWIVLKKELKDTFRDKKTIFTSIIIPILIFPILAFAMGKGTSSFINEGSQPVEIAIISEGENLVTQYLREHEDVNVIDVEDPYKALDKLEVKAIVKTSGEINNNIQAGKSIDIEVIYDESSQKSDMGRSRVEFILSQYSQIIGFQRLQSMGIDPNILNVVNIERTSTYQDAGEGQGAGFGLMMFSMILPMMLTIWSAVGGIAAATDLGAGEKERQTLEPLLTTKASRSSLLMGKYFAVVVAGMMGTIASLIGFLIATKISPDFLGSGVIIPPLSILIIALLCIGLSLVFSSVELAISFYARNFKEAQTYLTPITIILLIPSYATMYLDGKSIPTAYFHIPVINTIAIIKQALVSVINPMNILIVAGWTAVYIFVAIFITVRMFKKESVVFRA